MAHGQITYKRGDFPPFLSFFVETYDGTAVPLGGNNSVEFILKRVGGSTVVTGACEIVGDGSTGEVRFHWSNGDLDTVGTYRAEFQISFEDGTRLTAPSDGYLIIEVAQDLDNA